MSSVRRVLKGTAERLLAGSGLPGFTRRRHAGHSLVLAFHNVIATGEQPSGDRPLHLPVRDFERFVDSLTATHDIVALDALDTGVKGDRPRAAITFDDAYAGAVHLALPILAARSLPATIFVAPGILGRPACWWDRFADPALGLGADIRDHALHRLRGEDIAVAKWATERRLPENAVSDAWRIATVEELTAAASRTGVTLGAHSWNHPNLTELNATDLGVEMEKPLTWLRERFPATRPWLAFPYGMTSPVVEQAAEAAGYTLGFRVSGGWITSAAGSRLYLPRWSVPAGMSGHGFVLHASGILGD